ncbi:MarR family transcriptional regulator [Demequina sp. SYSU T00192]|uniref:MarR family transcriptional regulator n=1 Tax=Demequina litoralis TaxID=3051660 RepID=A0ABT8GBT9_9MICO|nr:MarR family transcriptional regulator [Demequina sp. SYSU T00192]MDN4476601.1 MarR family transcriptional regulator [Demequina sp. SYSU T00192]
MARESAVEEVVELQGRLMRSSVRHQARTLVEEGLTPVQFHLLMCLHERPGMPTAEAADATGLRPNIASGVVQRLVERGWVERGSAPEDGRVRLLSLTAEGVALVEQAVEEAERGFVEHLDALSDEQILQLRGILATILAAGEAGQSA